MSLNAVLIASLLTFTVSLVFALIATLSMHPTPLLARGSVRRAATALLPAGKRLERARRLAGRHQAWGVVLVFVVVMAVTFVPDPAVSISPLDNAKSAEGYLQTLWQVLAAVLGISIVLIAFVLEAFVSCGERRYGGPLREFAADTGLLVAIDLAAASLVAVGVVLQGNLRDAPAGWSGAMAILFSGLALVSLLTVLPRRILRAIDPEELRRMRSVRAHRSVDDALREQLIGQLGDHLLLSNQNQWRVSRGLAPSTQSAIVAKRGGYLYDIRMGTLRRAARRLPDGARIDVLVSAGDEIEGGQPLVSLPAGADLAVRLYARRVFVVRRRRRAGTKQAFDRTLDRLGQQGASAIQGRQEADWREINDVYREVLVKLPTVTHEFGIPFDGAVSRPGLVGWGPMSRILDDLRDDLREVLRVDDTRIAEALAYTFLRVAGDVATLSAPAMIRDTLGMYVVMYVLARSDVGRRGETQTNQLLLELSHDLLFEGLNRVSGYGLRGGNADLGPEVAAANLRTGLRPAQQYLRALVTRGDTNRLQKTLKGLADLIEPWAESQFQQQEARDILREIDGMVLVVAMWAAHLHRTSEETEADPSGLALALLLPLFSSGDQIMRAYETVAAGRGESLGEDWGFWFYDEEQGGVQSLGGEAHLDRATVLAFAAVAGAHGDLSISSTDILSYRADGLIGAVGEVEGDPRWKLIVPSSRASGSTPVAPSRDPFDAALGMVGRALETAASDRAAAAAAELRQASLDATQVEQFRRSTIQAARGGRVIRDLMAHVEAMVSIAPPVEPVIVSRSWMNKGFFTGDKSFVGQDMTTRDLARQASMAELRGLRELLSAETAQGSNGEIRGSVESMIGAMRLEGLKPSLVIIPIGFQLAQALGVQAFRTVSVESPAIPVSHSAAFRGLIADVPVMSDPGVDSDRLFIVDLRCAARLEEWPSDSNSGIEVLVQGFEAESAAAFVTGHPGVVPEDSTPERTIDILQRQVLIELRRCWRMVSRDSHGVRALQIPEDLRRESAT